jgi:hypothetical protein
MMTTESLTPDQLTATRKLIEETGFLPMTPKAERLFAAAAKNCPNPAELEKLRVMFHDAGYLPRSKALKLVEMASH